MSILPRRLYARLVLLGAMAIAVTMALFGFHVTGAQMEFAENAVGRDAVTLAAGLAEGGAAYAAAKDYASVERDFRQSALRRDAILSLVLTDGGGRILARVGREQPGGPLGAGAAGSLAVPPRVAHDMALLGDRAVAWHPVGAGGDQGWVRAELSFAEFEEVRQSIWRGTLIATLLAILGSALLFAAFLLRPMREIRRAADFAARLDRERGSQLPPTTCADEVAQLIAALNRASVNLRLQEEGLIKEHASLEIHNRIFQLLAIGGDLAEILALVVESVEMERPGLIGSILLLAPAGKHLLAGAAPHLPEAYQRAIAGLAIGDGVISCGTAAYRVERVIVADIATHPYWAALREQAQQAGLAACWSEPVCSFGGAVIGSFALYSRTPQAPTEADIELLVRAAQFAGIVIERKRIEEELRLASSIYLASGEAMFVTDEDNRIVTVNPAFTRLTGYEPYEVIGQDPKMLGSGRNDKTVYIAMWQSLAATGQWQGEIWNRRKNGEEFAEWLTITTIRNEQGQLHRRIALFSDITEKKQAEEIIWQQANYDTLTGLPNRRLFRDRLRQELRRAQRGHKPMALLCIDLDRFKEVNDALGHDAGDLLLVEAAQRILGCVRDADTVARIGGDEFTATLPGLGDPNAIERVAQAIALALSEPFTLPGEVIFVSASIGIALFPDDAGDMESLLKNADQAMYAAKAAGRNGYSWFTPAMQNAAQIRRGLVRDLRSALAAEQFEVYYQPIVELSSGRIVKAEALLRWHHPTQGMISPTVFVPLAEEVNLIREIGDWVFRQVAGQARRWCEAGYKPFQISVNKSPRQFAPGTSHDEWLDHLREIGLPPECLIVEITEGLLLDDRPDVGERLRLFREAGVQIAIDDFGTGYSALSYLQKFDIDYVKIDKSFIQDLTTDRNDRALADAIVVMAHKLGLKVVAEGVETEQQRDYLAAAGCDYAQGFIYSKPVPVAEFEALLKNRAP